LDSSYRRGVRVRQAEQNAITMVKKALFGSFNVVFAACCISSRLAVFAT
jgi:hypothetical protein